GYIAVNGRVHKPQCTAASAPSLSRMLGAMIEMCRVREIKPPIVVAVVKGKKPPLQRVHVDITSPLHTAQHPRRCTHPSPFSPGHYSLTPAPTHTHTHALPLTHTSPLPPRLYPEQPIHIP
ncbi:hypothetical protein Vafri_20661, partial [Volvox africanus]